jgi:hypothetical protein
VPDLTCVGFDTDSHLPDGPYGAATWCALYLHNDLVEDLQRAWAGGLAVLLVWETSAERALQGQSAGEADGAAWVAKAEELTQALSVQLPVAVAACSTFDFDASEAQQTACLEYQRGFYLATGQHPTVAYCSGALAEALLAAGVVDHVWISGSRGYRGNQAFLATGRANLVQDVGDQRQLGLSIDIDSDLATAEALRWMWSKPEGTPK